MPTGKAEVYLRNYNLTSDYLQRDVVVDVFLPPVKFLTHPIGLLMVNDGQDMEAMGLTGILNELYHADRIHPIAVVAIHAGPERKLEYGTAGEPDYMNRGRKANLYSQFILQECIPWIRSAFSQMHFSEYSFAGFSLGGLMALDMVWHHPNIFRSAAVFSGSLWWRSKALDEGYKEDRDRIMHARIRKGSYIPGTRFFFQTGLLDETADRNNNGIIDSVDDTLDLINELGKKGYLVDRDIRYLELADGRHDIATWGRAFPEFLTFIFGK